jgi:hypothetical protein
MKKSGILIVGVYGILTTICLLVGYLFPDLKEWSYWMLGTCGGHAALSLIIAGSSVVDGGKIAAWFWHGISTLIVTALLVVYALYSIRIILIAAAILGAATIIITLAFLILLRTSTTKSQKQPC